ncbi:MAG: carboxy terminal-processing peptidase [Luteolibacter sp.]|uniref:carboxy terminal-processing peptidase n=1 Tax=Luteolibacter sp. TaxID=1962973 RepID=UPI0032636D4B
MKPKFKIIIPAVTITASLITSYAVAFGFRNEERLDAEGTDAAITALTSKLLENSQFAHQQLNDEMAGKFLDRYLNALDGGHMIFLQSDLDEFARVRPKLAKATREEGDSKIAHTIFKCYLERLGLRATFISDLLANEKFDFSADENFSYDRKEAPHPADMAAAKILWTQQLRYEFLQEKLAGKKDEEITKTLGRRSTRLVETMKKLDEKAVLEIYLEALAQVYDPHSDYMGPEQMKSFEITMNLSLIGIGATLQSQDGYCKIMELVPGGPAARSGLLKNGDRIVGVSQKSGNEFTDLIDLPLSQAVDLIRGKKGTPVFLNVIPANAADDSVRKNITIVREEIKLEDQQAKARIIDMPSGDAAQRIGVIDLPAFYAGEGNAKAGPTSATADVSKLITKLKDEKVTGLILDLRHNGGGSLQEAISLAGLFIPSGPVVQTRSLDGEVEIGKDRDGKVAYDGPLVVLTSRFSASASEIVAGALQDYGRAVVVGDTSTFGKGTVQTIVPLDRIMQGQGLIPNADPGALKVTISKFYRPSGKSTQLEGVKADVVIPSLSDFPEIGESDLGNPLPWDTIETAKFTPSNRVTASIDSLRTRSTDRIAKSPDFSALKAEAERFKKLREDKVVSLNEAKRLKEKEETKERAENAKKERLARGTNQPKTYELTLKTLAKPGPGELITQEKPKINPDADLDGEDDLPVEPTDDIVLHEARNILIDYIGLLKGQPVVSQR